MCGSGVPTFSGSSGFLSTTAVAVWIGSVALHRVRSLEAWGRVSRVCMVIWLSERKCLFDVFAYEHCNVLLL